MKTNDKTLADAQPGGRVRLGDGWTGWATQYPNKMPKLCGAREIAELNHYPEEWAAPALPGGESSARRGSG